MGLAEPAAVQHVAVKPPAFMETAVQGWFAIMEAQFHLAKISSDTTKFYHVLAALPPTTVSKLDTSVLASNSFAALREAVCSLYERTRSELFDQLISKVQLTGRPSLFVRELQEIGGKVGVGDDLVRHKLLQSLPPAIGAVLAAQRDLTLHQLGKLADELMPLFQPASCFTAPTLPQQQQVQPLPLQHQWDQPPAFQPASCFTAPALPQHQQLQPLPQQQQWDRQPAARASGRSRDPPPAEGYNLRGLLPFYRDQRPQVCRAHLYFGQEARTCKPWCRWPKKGDLRMEPSSRRGSPQRHSGN